MNFTDPLFLFFFAPIVVTSYCILPGRLRNAFLLLASIGFYAWGEGQYAVVLLASMGLNYFFGLAIARASSVPKKRAALWTGITLNVLLLGVFKYLSFFADNANVLLMSLFGARISVPTMHLPAGISFYTFMGLSYLIDAYRGEVAPESSPVRFGLYIALFPHLLAGPIVRYGKIAGELRSRTITLAGAAEGIKRVVIGLGKKLLIANTVAGVADKLFAAAPAGLTMQSAWLGAMCYAIQIYYDFSGYSDIAIGLARIFGFTFPENFNYPYVARSITEFWTRWHISLSTWLRDYLFYPLGVRGGRLKLYRNILIVFFICGLWHGANWRFVIWGLFYGVFLIVERAGLLGRLSRTPAALQHVYTLLVVLAGWVLFRAETLDQGRAFLAAMVGLSHATGQGVADADYLSPDVMAALVCGIVGATPVLPALNRAVAKIAGQLGEWRGTVVQGAAAMTRVAGLSAIFVLSVAQSAAGTYLPFIYFRF